MRPDLTTAKFPAQSARPVRRSLRSAPVFDGGNIGIRKRTMPHPDGRFDRHASSPKSLVERQQNTAFRHRSRQDIWIRTTGGIRANPGYVVAGCTQCRDGIARKVLVGEEPHRHAVAAGYTFSDCKISLAY
jgi:hypothetical protein